MLILTAAVSNSGSVRLSARGPYASATATQYLEHKRGEFTRIRELAAPSCPGNDRCGELEPLIPGDLPGLCSGERTEKLGQSGALLTGI